MQVHVIDGFCVGREMANIGTQTQNPLILGFAKTNPDQYTILPNTILP